MLKAKWEKLGDCSPLAALKSASETKWLIDGVIPSGSLNWMVASPSSFKTFVAIDMAACVSTGRAWHGRETKEAVVLYMAGEGDADVHVRRAAAEMAAGDAGLLSIAQVRPRLDEATGLAALRPLISAVSDYELGATFNIYDMVEKYLTEDEQNALGVWDEDKIEAEVVRPRLNGMDETLLKYSRDYSYFLPDECFTKQTPKTNVFLIIDTYSQTSADDSKGTVSAYIKTLKAMQDEVRAQGGTLTILVIDHTTKSGDSYMGSLAKEGDSDTMIEVNRRGNDYAVTLNNTKMRSAACFEPIHLNLEPFTLDGFNDALGRPLTSLIVVDGEQAHKVRKIAGEKGDTAAALLLSLITRNGASSKTDLKESFTSHTSNAKKTKAAISRAFDRALSHLENNGIVFTQSSGFISITQDEDLLA